MLFTVYAFHRKSLLGFLLSQEEGTELNGSIWHLQSNSAKLFLLCLSCHIVREISYVYEFIAPVRGFSAERALDKR